MKRLKYLSTLLVAAVALIAAWLLWNFYTQSPWTRDGKVRAEQVGITPQVSGSIPFYLHICYQLPALLLSVVKSPILSPG